MRARIMLIAAAGLSACAPVDSTFEPPDLDFNRMLQQPRYDAYGMSPFFEDLSAMRRPPEGTVPFVGEEGPPPEERHRPTLAMLLRGREHYQHTCAPCHGIAGTGDTPVADRMELRPPPSLHTDKARSFTDAQLRDIVRDGYGLMPSYEHMLDRPARFTVVAYLRALQVSQHVRLADLPSNLRNQLPGVEP